MSERRLADLIDVTLVSEDDDDEDNGEMKFFDRAERRKREARRQRLRSVLVPTIPLDPRPEIVDDDEN